MFFYPILVAIVTANIILMNELKPDRTKVETIFDFFISCITHKLVHICIIKNSLKYSVSFKNIYRDAKIVSVSYLFHLPK